MGQLTDKDEPAPGMIDGKLNTAEDTKDFVDSVDALDGDFEEGKHPRDHGKFSSKPGAKGGEEKPSDKKEPAQQQQAPSHTASHEDIDEVMKRDNPDMDEGESSMIMSSAPEGVQKALNELGITWDDNGVHAASPESIDQATNLFNNIIDEYENGGGELWSKLGLQGDDDVDYGATQPSEVVQAMKTAHEERAKKE